MTRRSAPAFLREAFRQEAMRRQLYGPIGVDQWHGCWLAGFDRKERACSGRIEAIHVIPEQRLRNFLYPLLPPDSDGISLLAEWDPRNAWPACTHHHRRFDSHATPELKVPRIELPDELHEFIADWGLEPLAEARFI